MAKKKYRFWLVKLLFVAVVISILPAQQVYAGGINSEEQEVVEVLSSDFTYEGITYRADPQYLQMAIDYLKRDDIDLTPEQKEKAFNKIYSNVKLAVDSKYILPVSEEATMDKEKPKATVTPTEPAVTEKPEVTVAPTKPAVTEKPEVTVAPTKPAVTEKPEVTPTKPVVTEQPKESTTPTKPVTEKPTIIQKPTKVPTSVPKKESTVTITVTETQKEQEVGNEPIPESTSSVTEIATPSVTLMPASKEQIEDIKKEDVASFSFSRVQTAATIFLIIAGALTGVAILGVFAFKKSHKRGKKLYDVIGITGTVMLATIFVLLTTTFCGAFLNQRSVTLAAESGLIHQNYETYQTHLTQELYGTQITAEAVNELMPWKEYYLINEQFLQSTFLHNSSKDLVKQQAKKKDQLATHLKGIYGAEVLSEDQTLLTIADKIVDDYYDFSLYQSLTQIRDNQTIYSPKMIAGVVLCLLGSILFLFLLGNNARGQRDFLRKIGGSLGIAAVLCVPISFLLTMQTESSNPTSAFSEFWNKYHQMLLTSNLIGAMLLLLLGAIIVLGIKYKDKKKL